MGAAEVISLLLALLDRASAIGALIGKAQSEGRDVTEVEIDTIIAADDAAKTALEAAIARRRAAP